MRKNLLFLALFFLAIVARAEDGSVVIEGIKYELSRTEAEVATYGVYIISDWEEPFFCSSCGTPYAGDIVIPASVTYENVNYTVTSIGKNAFNNCSGLKSVVLPNTIKSIKDRAFYRCNNLGSITLPDQLISIDGQAFKGCSALVSVVIPASVAEIGTEAFGECTNLTSIIVDSENKMFDSRNNCNAIIETPTNTLLMGCRTTLIPPGVTTVKSRAFSDCSGLTSITTPSSLQTIEPYAFQGCKNLVSVSLSSNVISIGGYAFSECIGLKEVYCEVKEPLDIEDAVFDRVDIQYTLLYVPAGSEYAYQKTNVWRNFMDISAIGDVSHAFTVDGINYDFVDEKNLEVIGPRQNIRGARIPEVVDYQGSSYTVSRIAEDAFYGNDWLTVVSIPVSVLSVGDSAFAACDYLKTIFLERQEPISVSQNAFYGVEAKLMVPPNSRESYLASTGWGNAFERIEEYEAERVVNNPMAGTLSETMADADIQYFKSLKLTGELNGTDIRFVRKLSGCIDPFDSSQLFSRTYYVNEGIFSVLDLSEAKIVSGGNWYSYTHVDETGPEDAYLYTEEDCISPYMFAYSNLKAIYLPKTIKQLGERAFYLSKNLTDVYCYLENVPETDVAAFDGVPTESATLHVPASAIEAYRSAWPWSDFKEIIALENGETSVGSIKRSCSDSQAVYTIDGRRLASPRKGMNIIRMNDGSFRKVVIK